MATANYKQQNRQVVLFKMLANGNRLRILKLLQAAPSGGLDVSSIARLVDLPQPKVSDHLKLMRIHKLVHATQSGTSMYYAIRESSVSDVLKAAA